MKIQGFILAFFLFSFGISFSQIVINELDSDTEGIDYEEFIELKTEEPFAPLDDYVLVFFNGSVAGENKSYLTIDLEGYTSDINGIFLIGSTFVSPVPDLLIPPNIIQNGVDAVGIYVGNADDFPNWTLATTDNLIDALVYGNSHPVSTDLLELLGQTEQIDENINNNKDFESIQRNPDGTYFVGPPTPGANNDGSGVILNGISVEIPNDQYEEGETFEITFTTENPVEVDLNFDFSLNNENFNEEDFSGFTSVFIPQGETSASVSIHLIEDGIEEGDEILIFQFGLLPPEFRRLNDFLEVRVIDLDFRVADFGTPLNPTYGLVESTQPEGYYDSLDGLSGDDLRQALQDIIANPDVVRAHSYADMIDVLKQTDQNPENSNEVWLVYLEKGRSKLDFQTTSSSMGKWNREHTFPRSRAGYEARQGDDIADGINIFWPSHADSLRHGFSDAFALRAADGPENTVRSNQNYGPQEYDGPEGTMGSFYGDVARGVLFLEIRYNGLSIVEGYPSAENLGQLGDLQSLLEWHQTDPPDDFEMNRNNIIYNWQKNRNPFIDYPELVDYLWGEKVGEVWHQPDMKIPQHQPEQIKIYPNPTTNRLFIEGNNELTVIEIYTMEGRKLKDFSLENKNYLDLNLASGIYILKLHTPYKIFHKKLIIK